MSVSQIIVREIESAVYDQIHKLLGMIAADYDLDHGAMVDKYLVKPREGSPAPQYIYTSSGDEELTQPRRATRAPKKKKVVESDDDEAVERAKCQGTTKAGKPCKNSPFGGGCFCRVHTPKEGEEEEPKKKAKAKPESKKSKRVSKAKKAEVPKHSHTINEECEEGCELFLSDSPARVHETLKEVTPKLLKVQEYFVEMLKMDIALEDITQEMIEEYDTELSRMDHLVEETPVYSDDDEEYPDSE
jgi:hypothetical protein